MSESYLWINGIKKVKVRIVDADSGEAVVDASPVFTVKDSAGATVGTANHAMTHVSAGLYSGTWPKSEAAGLIDQAEYDVVIDGANIDQRVLPHKAKYRGKK